MNIEIDKLYGYVSFIFIDLADVHITNTVVHTPVARNIVEGNIPEVGEFHENLNDEREFRRRITHFFYIGIIKFENIFHDT